MASLLRGRCVAAAALCVQLALRAALAKQQPRDPPGIVVEDTSGGVASSPDQYYPRVQSMVGMEGSASLFEKLDQYQRTGTGSGAGVKQVTYVKTPYSIGEPHLDPHRRAWVPIRPDIGAIDETLAETGAKSVGRAHIMSRGSSRIWLLAPFTIGEPSYDDATHATFVPFYSAAQDGAGLYSVHSPTPDRGPLGDITGEEKPHDPKMYDCGTNGACRPECKGCWCTLSHILPFGECAQLGCCSSSSSRSMRLSSKSVGDATDVTPLPRGSYMSQPTFPDAVSYPPMRPWTPPGASAGQRGGEQFNDYGYGEMSDEYGAPR